ncbi:MAG: amino acid adenylation domain-containing protein [Flavobacteriales bacterium]|nr:amino acid adenylation domain-containing protein [Flavobacteriales bacterium]
MHKLSGQTDITLGTPVAGRNHVDLENQIGLYVNTLALRSKFDSEDNFDQLLDNTITNIAKALKHQVYPFNALLENLDLKVDISRNPLFDVMIVLQNSGTAVHSTQTSQTPDENAEMSVHSLGIAETTSSKFDLLYSFYESGDELGLTLEYNTDIYQESTINRMLEHLEQVFIAVIQDSALPLKSLNWIGTKEQQHILDSFNQTDIEIDLEQDVLAMFAKMCEQYGDTTAILLGDTKFTYNWLDQESSKLSVFLKDNYQLQTGDLVAIGLPRTQWTIVSMLAVFKARCAYLPIDLNYPEDRIQFMLDDSNCKLVIDQDLITNYQNNVEKRDDEVVVDVSLGFDDLAYVIYTSGSTGRPKGTMIQQRNLTSFLHWAGTEFAGSDVNIVYAATSICFDLSIFEIFYSLTSGKTIRLLENAMEIKEYLNRDTKILINTVPSVVGTLLDNETDLSSVVALNMAGEPIPQTYLERLDYNKMEIRNLYGPSEDTTYSTVYRIQSDEKILIGKPIANTKSYILDENQNMLPIGLIGEICLSGAGLSSGYLNREDLTNEKFISNPFEPNTRIYKTGDLGRWLPNGNIEFLGRIDSQVKLRGYRIGLNEIDRHLEGYSRVNVAKSIVRKDEQGQAQLIAYVEMTEEPLVTNELKSHLLQFLPGYMIPEFFVVVDEMPRNPNGKIDVSNLPQIGNKIRNEQIEFVPAEDEIQRCLVNIWTEILGQEKIGILDNFFDLGGNSIKLIRMVDKVNRTFQKSISYIDAFRLPNISTFSDLIAGETGEQNLGEFNQSVDTSVEVMDQTLNILESID